MSLIDPVSVRELANRYPRAPGRLSHHLAAEPLLGYAALARAARALAPHNVERQGLDVGHPADAIAAGGAECDWIMLRRIERLPAYRKLLDRLLAELAPVITPATGAVRGVRASVAISAPGTPTPFHFDTQYSILFQIAGDKVCAAYPPVPPFLDLDRREAYHVSGRNLLEWKPAFAASGEQHLLAPGDALFVPYAAPHWVRAGMGPSISLSVTWQCRASRAIGDALALNPLMRRLGLSAYDPVVDPAAPWLRATASRAGRKIGLMSGT